MEIPSFFPGILAFLGYYELLSGFSVPFRFTVDRVTHPYLVRLPLLGWLELDYIVYAAALIGVILVEEGGRPRRLHMVLASLATASILVGRMINTPIVGYLGLGLSALASASIHVYKRGLERLLPGILVSATAMEVLALTSLVSYYVLGEWYPIPFHIVLRERLLWTPLEWVSAPLLVVSMWIALAEKFLGIGILPELNRFLPGNVGEDSGCGSKLVFVSILLISIMIVLPHLPTVNPSFKPVSVDTVQYAEFLESVGEKGLLEALKGKAERPLFILLAYSLWLAFSKNSILLMDVFHPAIALSILALTSYYVTLKMKGVRAAGWASILVALGYTVPAFLGGGFQANSLALTPALIALTIEPQSITGTMKLTLPLTVTALLHPWTYTMYSAAVIVKYVKDKKKLISSLAAVALSYAVSQVVDYSLGAIIVAEATANPVTRSIGLHIPLNWFDAVQLWVWNTLSNPLYISISLLSTQTISPLLAAAAPLTLILPAELLFRIFLNTPFQVNSSDIIAKLKPRYKLITLITLLVRVLGNLSGLTPLETSI